jgi:hypothetical protein
MTGDDGNMDPTMLFLDPLPKRNRKEVFLEEMN